MGTQSRRPEALAAVVNAIVVLFLPSITLAVLYIDRQRSPYAYGTTVHPPGWSPLPGLMQFVLVSAILMSPLALLAAWRTWVHARRWRSGNPGRSLQGVLEAGACGLGVALLILLRPTILRPLQAPPYLIAYGGIGFVVGFGAGLVLLLTGAAVLAVTGRTAA